MVQAQIGTATEDDLSSLATRLARLDRGLTEDKRAQIETASGGLSPRDLAHALLDALDPDVVLDRAGQQFGIETPTEGQIAAVRAQLIDDACVPFDNPLLHDDNVSYGDDIEAVHLSTLSQDGRRARERIRPD